MYRSCYRCALVGVFTIIKMTELTAFLRGIAAVYIANKLLEVATWRWAYYAAIIYSAVAFIGTYIVYKPPKRPQHDLEKTRWQEIKELDYVGIFLYSIGVLFSDIGDALLKLGI